MHITLLGTAPHQRWYGTDGQGFAWAMCAGPLVPCDLCGACITGGWHAHAQHGMPARYLCSAHMETCEPERPAAP